MIYQYTGQPGHGKTLHALERALEFKDEGRTVFVCNVREFDSVKAGVQSMTPEQFKDWPNSLPDGAVVLVDECYEHGMLGKLGPSCALPEWVEQLAKHRHRGLDFILVCQSPTKQMHPFIHDLIENHVHVRRRFGTSFVHLRVFDRFEPRPEKAHPLVLKRVRLPKRPMGLYKSTELDTTEKKVPWYYYVAALLVVGIAVGAFFVFKRIDRQFSPKDSPPIAAGQHGAQATGAAGPMGAKVDLGTPYEYALAHLPRFPGMPWTAKIFDGRSPTADPQVFCMSSPGGIDANGERKGPSCTCLTEQSTRYDAPEYECRRLAVQGAVYNPYKEKSQDRVERGAGAPPAVTGPIGAASPAVLIPGVPAAPAG